MEIVAGSMNLRFQENVNRAMELTFVRDFYRK